jgi:cytidine deaminase
MSEKFLHKVRDSEIFIGLVGAVGTNINLVSDVIKEELVSFNYQTESIIISKLIAQLPRWSEQHTVFEGEEDRINKLMDLGDTIREEAGGEALAILSVLNITEIRRQKEASALTALKRHAYIIKSLKTVEEVKFFRKLYGDAFILISVYSPPEERTDFLAQRIADSKAADDTEHFRSFASRLIEKDQKNTGTNKFGQNVQDTFPLGDFFIRYEEKEKIRPKLARLLDIWFGHPFLTPRKEEHAMFLANAASLRSADLSRQVGSVIVNNDGDLLSMGCNEVPKVTGGCPWPEEGEIDFRDFQNGFDPSVKMKERIIAETLEKLKEANWLKEPFESLDVNKIIIEAIYADEAPLKKSRISSILEFGRIVHAEMNAITDSAKRGVPLKGMTLYCTTYPCHMCARHIISAGIKEVVFIEPYPKSMAKKLYGKMIDIDSPEKKEFAVNFKPFEGIAPNRYISFFSMGGKKRKTPDGEIYKWNRGESYPQVESLSSSYILVENSILKNVEQNLYKFGLSCDNLSA